MVHPNVDVTRIVHLINELELQVVKTKLDNDLCLCKKDLLIVLIRRLQHIAMLSASTKYILSDTSIQEITNKLTDIRKFFESTTFTDYVSSTVEQYYFELIYQILNTVNLDIVPKASNFDRFIRILRSKILKVYNVLEFVFKVTYPVCEHSYNPVCTEVCKQECLNKQKFEITTIIVPVFLNPNFNGFYETIYDVILKVTSEYFTNIKAVICDELNEKVINKLYKYNVHTIEVSNKCPVDFSTVRICRKVRRYVH